MSRFTLDLHDIYGDGRAIDAALEEGMARAVSKRIRLVEIIPGKGSGQLKKRVLRFLVRPDIKPLYHRIEKDDKNFGRIFVHFRH
ncbi:MAG TPA: Smr/MutS family protein [bacterium]